jgi:hypothetical protein
VVRHQDRRPVRVLPGIVDQDADATRRRDRTDGAHGDPAPGTGPQALGDRDERQRDEQARGDDDGIDPDARSPAQRGRDGHAATVVGTDPR